MIISNIRHNFFKSDSDLAVDDIEIGRGALIPLWLFGMLY